MKNKIQWRSSLSTANAVVAGVCDEGDKDGVVRAIHRHKLPIKIPAEMNLSDAVQDEFGPACAISPSQSHHRTIDAFDVSAFNGSNHDRPCTRNCAQHVDTRQEGTSSSWIAGPMTKHKSCKPEGNGNHEQGKRYTPTLPLPVVQRALAANHVQHCVVAGRYGRLQHLPETAQSAGQSR